MQKNPIKWNLLWFKQEGCEQNWKLKRFLMKTWRLSHPGVEGERFVWILIKCLEKFTVLVKELHSSFSPRLLKLHPIAFVSNAL